MSSLKHLLAFDLSSYGAALLLLNQFVDGETIINFEIAPCGTQAQLILISHELLPLQFVQKEAQAILGSQILATQLIQNLHPELLEIYLSQNKVELNQALLILEGSFVSEGLALLQNLLMKNFKVVEFRVVRTSPKNIIVIATAPKDLDFAGLIDVNFKKTIIASKQEILNNFF